MDRYKITKTIGEGTFGIVYKAKENVYGLYNSFIDIYKLNRMDKLWRLSNLNYLEVDLIDVCEMLILTACR